MLLLASTCSPLGTVWQCHLISQLMTCPSLDGSLCDSINQSPGVIHAENDSILVSERHAIRTLGECHSLLIYHQCALFCSLLTTWNMATVAVAHAHGNQFKYLSPLTGFELIYLFIYKSLLS